MSRAAEYDEFARTRSLPMFKRHQGFCGVLFATSGELRVVMTFWGGRESVAALERSRDYLATVEAIEAAGFLQPPQHVEVLEVGDGYLECLERLVR